MPVNKHPWATRLSTALQVWCQEKGYVPFNRLRDELEIQAPPWGRILSGWGITESYPEYYAKIFLRTGLKEADPRKIPPRVRTLKTGCASKNRAWTEEQWQAWLSQQQGGGLLASAPVHEDKKEPSETQTTQPLPQEGLTIGGVLDTFISLLGSQIGKAVAPHIAQAVSEAASKLDIEGAVQKALSEYTAASRPGSARVNKIDLRQIGNELFGALEPYIYGTTEDRDHLQTTYGDVLQKLAPAIGILSDEGPERERNLPIWLESYQTTKRTRRR